MNQTLVEGIADRLRQGDHSAFECLVSAFHRQVYRFLICRGVESGLAEELTGETFFQLVRGFAKFRGNDDQVRAFVYATARNVRASNERRSRNFARSHETASEVIDRIASPLQVLLSVERGEQLAAAIEHLSDIAREVVVLRFVEDLSIEEIAATCSLPIGTVKSHLYRAKQDLKRILTKAEVNDE
jgi:RNA polymerase sigma-70 factor, ECF subfamily